jgi:nickel/cobalt exporter
MTSFADLIQQGTANAWLFIPSAILLGALHGLEPGHSKTMMAAFIVAIRGTVWQAVLLGLAATVSHTAVVWAVAIGGMYLGRNLDAETSEPYFQIASSVLIVAIAVWMLWRTWQDQRQARLEGHEHGHAHDHDHRGGDVRRIDTGHGIVAIEVFEQGVPPKWRVRSERGHRWSADEVTIETERPDGRRQVFTFADFGGYLQSVEEIPQPREFMARVRLAHGGHVHDYDLAFVELTQGSDRIHEEVRGLDVATGGFQDAHQLAHANDIRRRFADRNVTTWQIVLFGLTGGLIPCPAAITVLLLCLQLKAIALGAALVLCFSIGLALTLVIVGAAAALSVQHAQQRWSWFGSFARRAPYASSLLIIAIGVYVGIQGWTALHA